MKTIDFSCKHDILIQNADGTFSPMDEPYYQAKLIAPDTWQILSSGDYSYLFAGEQEAVAIDTGYGAGNIRAYLQTLTDKPVRNVINTHSHFDHTANNGYFEKAYMAAAAVPLATIPYASFAGIEFIQGYERVAMTEGFIYDLGGRTLEVFDIPDHTVDGIALLDRRERLLVTGDEFMRMGKNLRVSVAAFYDYTSKLMAHRQEFDRLACGGGVFDAKMLDDYHACAAKILRGDRGTLMESHGGFRPRPAIAGPNGETVYDRMMPHPGDSAGGKDDSQAPRYVQTYGDVRIMYREDNIC